MTATHRTDEVSDRERVLAGTIDVGDYITTVKLTDTWWKVEGITTEPFGQGFSYVFHVVNKAGYRKEMKDLPGAGRRLYRWIEPARRG